MPKFNDFEFWNFKDFSKTLKTSITSKTLKQKYNISNKFAETLESNEAFQKLYIFFETPYII